MMIVQALKPHQHNTTIQYRWSLTKFL